MSSPGQVVASSAPGKTWLVACGVVCAAILAYGFAPNRDAGSDLAYQLGYNLPIAIFIAGLLHVFFRKREPARTSWIGFVVIYVSLVASAMIAANLFEARMRAVAVEVDKTMSAVQASVSTGSPLPAPLQVNTTAGNLTTVEDVVRAVVNRSLAQRREYELELSAIGWEKILDGTRLRADSTLVESRTMLQQGRTIVAKYRSRTDALYSQIRQDIESAALPSGARASMLAGFEKSATSGKTRAAQIWDMEEQVLSQFGAIIDLLSARRNGWQIQDGQIMFNRQADLDQFNAHIARIQSITERQQQLQNAVMQQTRDTMKVLGK